MNYTEEGWREKTIKIQTKIENRLHKITLSITEYFLLLTIAFTLTGVMLFFYCIYNNINPWMTDTVSSPIQYLGLGLCCFLMYFMHRQRKTKQ